jgi:membrane protein DedA with SNARE-associated domain
MHEARPAHHHGPRWQRLSVLLPLVGVHHVLALLGTIFFAALVSDNPALLLVLSSRLRHLLLVVPAGIPALPYFLIGFVRLTYPAVPYYALGRRYGESGIAWLEREAGGTPATIRWIERWFSKAAVPVILLMPASNVVQVLSGHRRVNPRLFAALVVGSITARLVAIWFLGKALEEPLTTLLDWIQRYQWWIVAGFFVLSVVQSSRQVRRTTAEHPPEETDDDVVADALDVALGVAVGMPPPLDPEVLDAVAEPAADAGSTDDEAPR